eukprot:3487840-Heterocapsa_arctica.AAC.1
MGKFTGRSAQLGLDQLVLPGQLPGPLLGLVSSCPALLPICLGLRLRVVNQVNVGLVLIWVGPGACRLL